MNYDIFNGDADGICSLIQLRKAMPCESTLVTGVKRDINLLDKIDAVAGDRITVLDVSMDTNKVALERVLHSGAEVFYADHHVPGKIPNHAGLTALINEAPDVCTAVLVNGHLGGQHIEWAITGAFGDNLRETGHRLARSTGLTTADQLSLEELGIYVNYNGYGPTIEDLHFSPEILYRTLYDAGDPLTFVHESADFTKLREGYREDMSLAAGLKPLNVSDTTAVFVMPNAAWARRVSGVYSNNLATIHPHRGHAVLTEKSNGNYLVSVRAPLSNKQGAAELCRKFPSGGGRAAAAGINDLPGEMLMTFVELFEQTYK